MIDPIVHLAPDQTSVDLPPDARKQALESAYWVTASPVEWSWSPREQAAMARYCLWAHQRLAAIGQLADGSLTRPPR